MNTAFLMLCHRPPKHLPILAKYYAGARFYLHYDAKSDLADLHFLRQLPNVKILNNRVAVNWGGFSMILATLNLMQAALAEPKNHYFHLLSGDCLPLQTLAFLEQEWKDLPAGSLFMESRISHRLRYRTRFNALHADTIWQRKLIGKLLTKCLQCLDWIIPTNQICYTGSQWFSADRMALKILFDKALEEPSIYFEKKLCPDEHFFQFVLFKDVYDDINHINDNKRFINLHSIANHPEWLNKYQCEQAKNQGIWFARKVNFETIIQFWNGGISMEIEI